MEDSVESLVGRAREGDREAFGDMVRQFGPRLYSYLACRMRSRELAEDAYAETWLRVWRALASYKSKGRFQPWLFTIAHRLSLDLLEKESRRPHVSIDAPPLEDGFSVADRAPSAEPGPEREALSGEAGARLRNVLDALPDEQRQVFLLREYGGLSFAQIADAMGSPLSTALARMRYAVLKLREELEDLHA